MSERLTHFYIFFNVKDEEVMVKQVFSNNDFTSEHPHSL